MHFYPNYLHYKWSNAFPNQDLLQNCKIEQGDQQEGDQAKEAEQECNDENKKGCQEEVSEKNNDQSIEIDFSVLLKQKFKTTKEAESEIKEWALSEGLQLIQGSKSKSYGVYLKCNRCGEPQRFVNRQGKRTKGSIKIGKCIFSI